MKKRFLSTLICSFLVPTIAYAKLEWVSHLQREVPQGRFAVIGGGENGKDQMICRTKIDDNDQNFYIGRVNPDNYKCLVYGHHSQLKNGFDRQEFEYLVTDSFENIMWVHYDNLKDFQDHPEFVKAIVNGKAITQVCLTQDTVLYSLSVWRGKKIGALRFLSGEADIINNSVDKNTFFEYANHGFVQPTHRVLFERK